MYEPHFDVGQAAKARRSTHISAPTTTIPVERIVLGIIAPRSLVSAVEAWSLPNILTARLLIILAEKI
jgi:hypothetical protein